MVPQLNPIPVSSNTERILNSRRSDDFRIDIICSLMFDDDMGGMHKDRTIVMDDKDDKGENVKKTVRKAGYLDTMRYMKVASEDMTKSIEQNIQSLHAMKQNGQGMQGLPPIKDVFLFVYILDGDDIKVNSYMNPNSSDIGDILRTDKTIIMCGFVVTYNTVFPGQELPEGYPEEVYEWVFMSPLMEDCLEEYNKVAAKFEAEELTKMFFLEFKA